jgi:isocitrate dehydrogenase
MTRQMSFASPKPSERVCIDTVEGGKMTRDLAILIGPDHPWLTTNQFLDTLDANLQRAMA